jgi:hypothetical protein
MNFQNDLSSVHEGIEQIKIWEKLANNNMSINLNADCDDKTNEEVGTAKFLGLQISSNLNCKAHMEYNIPKLISLCFSMRTVTSITYKNRYFTCFHFMVPYGVIFWGRLVGTNNVFEAQKKNITVMAGVKRVCLVEFFCKKLNVNSLAGKLFMYPVYIYIFICVVKCMWHVFVFVLILSLHDICYLSMP